MQFQSFLLLTLCLATFAINLKRYRKFIQPCETGWIALDGIELTTTANDLVKCLMQCSAHEMIHAGVIQEQTV